VRWEAETGQLPEVSLEYTDVGGGGGAASMWQEARTGILSSDLYTHTHRVTPDGNNLKCIH
jgi:hypothetical protein